MSRTDIRLGLPSKGVLAKGALAFLENCGLSIHRPNPRQYVANIPSLPQVTVLFQRPGDIVVGVREGSLDLGVTGYDMLAEKAFGSKTILTLHDALGFAGCTLNLAVPQATAVTTLADLAKWAKELAGNGRSLRVATKFPNVTRQILDQHNIQPYRLISAEGTLEIAPAIGFADLIADLVSSGMTLRDNHLRIIEDGLILRSEACLIANKDALKTRQPVLDIAHQLLEFTEAYLRAKESFQVTANVRGKSPEAIAKSMLDKPSIRGLQGPTISQVVAHNGQPQDKNWYAINIIVRKKQLSQAVAELRSIGGSGVIVTPCAFIFEEEPERYQAMLRALGD